MLKRLTLLSLLLLPVHGLSERAAPTTPVGLTAAVQTARQPHRDRAKAETAGTADADPSEPTPTTEHGAIASNRNNEPVRINRKPGVESAASGSRPERQREALWVWTDEITSSSRRRRLIEDAFAYGYNTLYLNVYRPTPNSSARRMYEDDDMAALISEAARVGIEVWAAYGNPDWVELGVREGSPPKQRFDEIIAYNEVHPEASFAGIILDVEPPEPVDQQAVIHFFSDALQYLTENGVAAAAAIRYFWKDPAEGPTGEVGPAHEHVIGMAFNHVVVMGYRNYAGEPGRDNGLIAVNQDHLAFAHNSRRDRAVLIGLRTTPIRSEGGHPIETFYGSSPSILQRAKTRVERHFAENRGFGGFATHRYDPSGLATSFPVLAANEPPPR